MVIVVWLLAYTVSLFDLGLLLYRYLRLRDRSLLFLLLLIADMVFTTVVVMVLVAMHVPALPFALVLGNVLLTYYLSVPYLAYEASGLKKPHLLIFASLAASAILVNVLVLAGDAWVIDGLSWAPLVVSFVPFFVPRNWAMVVEPPEPAATLRRNIGRVGMAMGGVSTILVLLYLLLSRTVFRADAFFQESYFAYFTILYQLPVLYLHLKGIPDVPNGGERPLAVGAAGLNLTPREEEVARRIFEGLTYEQIADAMFVTLSAVKKHAYNIYRKTGVSNSRQLIQLMIGSARAESSPEDTPPEP